MLFTLIEVINRRREPTAGEGQTSLIRVGEGIFDTGIGPSEGSVEQEAL